MRRFVLHAKKHSGKIASKASPSRLTARYTLSTRGKCRERLTTSSDALSGLTHTSHEEGRRPASTMIADRRPQATGRLAEHGLGASAEYGPCRHAPGSHFSSHMATMVDTSVPSLRHLRKHGWAAARGGPYAERHEPNRLHASRGNLQHGDTRRQRRRACARVHRRPRFGRTAHHGRRRVRNGKPGAIGSCLPTIASIPRKAPASGSGWRSGPRPIRYMTGRGAAVVGIGGYARPRAASR